MRLTKAGLLIVTSALAVACGPNDNVKPVNTSAPTVTNPAAPVASTIKAYTHKYQDWSGTWIGVEGMYVKITPLETGPYSLIMQSDLDTLGTYEGNDSEQGIEFTRDGKVLTLRAGSGAEIDLKHLAEKTDCLVVKSGEGYCRN